MRVFILTFFLVLCMSLTAGAETKIGFVDMKAVIAKSEPGSKAMEQLKSQFKDMKDNLDAQKKSLDTLKDELQKQSMMLSQEAKLDKETIRTMKLVNGATTKDLRYFLLKWFEKQTGVIAPASDNNWKVLPEDWAAAGAKKNYSYLYPPAK